MNSIKSVLKSPAFWHGLLIASHIAVALFVKNPALLATATTALSEADNLASPTK